jgi:hypothetical protein
MLATGAGAFAASSTTPTTTTTQGCATGALPQAVLGTPTLKAGDARGVYLWHDAGGYRLRLTHPGTARVTFTGTITAGADISNLVPVHLEKGDKVHLGKHNRTLTFRFSNTGGLDGLNFTTECSKRVHVTVGINGHQASPLRVYLGAHGHHPTSVPFTIDRANTTI